MVRAGRAIGDAGDMKSFRVIVEVVGSDKGTAFEFDPNKLRAGLFQVRSRIDLQNAYQGTIDSILYLESFIGRVCDIAAENDNGK